MGRAPRPPATVPQALGRLRVALNESFAQASRELDLTPQQAEFLCVALRPRSVGEIARMLRSDRSNVSRVADHVARLGLVKRRAGERDARVSVIELTPAGRDRAQRFINRLESLTAPLRSNWSAEHEQAAVETLNALASTIEATLQQAAPQDDQEPEPQPELWLLGLRDQH
jgi:DNA-binding MarR family transcriptional regulator